ncbi:MAG TPA: ATP-binding protein, partial [Gemmatirosa sp.]
GTVELDVAPDRRRHPPSVRITVRDTGVGIPPEQLGRVFDKFYQASNQDGASSKGTGLGLAISKEIVEAHGGFISVESTPGVRTEFIVTLPVTAHDATTLVTGDDRSAEHEPDAADGPTAYAESAS